MTSPFGGDDEWPGIAGASDDHSGRPFAAVAVVRRKMKRVAQCAGFGSGPAWLAGGFERFELDPVRLT